MKKLLLLTLGTGLWLCAGAQTVNSDGAVSHREAWLKYTGHRAEGTPAGLSNFYTQGSQSRNNEGKNARTASTGTIIGTAYNAYGVLDASTTAVTFNQQTHLICMTHRECMGFPYGSGAYSPSYSTDGGNTWDSTDFVLFKNQTSRYPNGVIYNPAGNTDPTQAYLVVAGPWTNNTDWVKSVYGSMRFDTTNTRNELIWANGTAGVQTQNNGNLSYMTSCDDSTVHLIGEGFNMNGANFTRYLGSVLTTGKFNGTNFTWSQQVIRPHLMDGFLGAPTNAPYDSLAFPLGTSGTAWSQDGKTGYVVIFGNLDSTNGATYDYNFSSYQPIVYRSTNSGATWTMMPPYNFRNIPNLVQYLKPTGDSGIPTPLWNLVGQGQSDENDYDLVVDMNGNLHIVGSVQAAFYTNNDSAYQIYSYLYPSYYLYDVYNTTANGGWKARFIDSMQCRPAYSVTTGTPWASGGTATVNYGARIQTTRTTGGDKIFYTWEDDLYIGDSASMVYPDVKGMGVDIAHHTATPVQTFTGTNDQYFLCVSDRPIVTGAYPNSIDSIPCTYVRSPNNNDGTSPVEFMYQANVVYKDAMFLGEQELNNVKAGFTVSGNYPNPFDGNTYFNVTLDKESTVAVDVFNMLGEKVESINPAKMAPGMHTITLQSKGMNTGVYFYRVSVNNQNITHKMVIE